MYKNIPTYVDGVWKDTIFESKKDYLLFIRSKIKKVGKYELYDTHLWRQRIIEFEENGEYCKYVRKSKQYIDFWEFEKKKSQDGVIINDFFITGHYYFYLNFCPIYNVLKQEYSPAEVWDSHYEYTLRCEEAVELGEHVVVLKKRRWGYSFLEVADIHRTFIFKRKSICKFVSKEEDPNLKNFSILDSYREYTNRNTGWYRTTMGSSGKKIEQKIEKKDLYSAEKSYSGRMSVVESVVTRLQPAKGVGLYLTKGLWDEAGINNMLIKSIQYNEKSVKQGGIVKGQIRTGGSVGELKDCEDLKTLIYNPKEYGFYAVTDPETDIKTGIFIPECYNYVENLYDSEDPEIIIGENKFYDDDGNSDVEGATAAIIEARKLLKNKSPMAYRLSLSQSPLNINEAFDEREENIFPTHLISPRFESLYEIKEKLGTPVELYRDNGKLKHKVVQNKKIWDFPLTRDTDRDATITIYEFPKPNPPLGLYMAGVDPVGSKKATIITTTSIMSCYIMKANNDLEEEFGEKLIVAELACRYDNYEDTYRRVADLCEFYNARTLVENNNEMYIQWLITEKRQKLLIKKGELNNLKSIAPNYNSLADYGVSVGVDLKNYLLDISITYLENPVSKVFDDITGNSTLVHGVDGIKDPMLLKEYLKWTPKLNTDRIIAFGLCLWAVNVFSEQLHKRVKKPTNNPVSKPIGMFRKTQLPMFRNSKMF